MQQQPLDAKKISEFLTNMKKQMAQVKGEMNMMENDATSSLFNNFAQMINQVFGMKEDADRRLKISEDTLEKIYQGHPDIKIALDKEAKEIAEINAKKATAGAKKPSRK